MRPISSPVSSSQRISDQALRLLLLAGLLAGFAVRLHHLGAESLWYDETVSAYLSKQPLGQIIAHTARDIHPPAYYLILHVWRALASPTLAHGFEFLLAFPSLFFGIAALALLVPIAKRALSLHAAALAVWLAALNPFLVWYSQEVRMYTLAAMLGLLCLFAARRYVTASTTSLVAPEASARLAWLGVYVLAATASLYTLYYAGFALVAINLAALWSLWATRRASAGFRSLRDWLLGQLAVLALFLPWLPILLRQIVEPPVPVWRVPWANFAALFTDLTAALSAFAVGQSTPASQAWVWALVALVVVWAFVRYAKSADAFWLLFYLFVPVAAIFLISAAFSPIYHVRYLAVYAPIFPLIAAGAILALNRRSSILALFTAALLVAGSLYSLTRFWTLPDYAADDHRGAVQALSEEWRPGDAILVNAGWAYTAVDTYWPSEIAGSDDARPAPLGSWLRLPVATGDALVMPDPIAGAALTASPALMTGSVDGPPSLGWGLPEADFFSMSAAQATSALDAVNRRAARLWHYRLYDTVSDPDGILRAWLAANMRLLTVQPFAGRDYLSLELYETGRTQPLVSAATRAAGVFGSSLALLQVDAPPALPAGETLYAATIWRAEPNATALEPPLAVSLRLIDDDGQVWAQHDQPIAVDTSAARPGPVYQTALALPLPAATPPGRYALQLIVYQVDTLEPLPALARSADEPGTSLSMGDVTVALPTSPPPYGRRIATFDYIDLLRADLATRLTQPGRTIALDLLWRPRPNNYVDTYAARFELRDNTGAVMQAWTEPLGGQRYPSGLWSPGFAVRDLHRLDLAGDVPPGDYSLWLGVQRSADGLSIPATRRLPWSSEDAVEIGNITIVQAWPD